jgi:hypothetical protein
VIRKKKETGRAARGKKETPMADDTSNNADFIGRVVGDAKNPPETRMLTGWFGDSGEEGFRRLYTDAELSSYVDIPTDAILYTEPIRDAQPAGAVLVWIKRDAAVKQGGSAFSRAARFLQGQVQQDFAGGGGVGAAAAGGSLEDAGLHCVTQVPCGEVTGFTGKCTNEPQVGGAWPCITAPPHCFEVTGFTGKCTHQPWPNPTRYIGCTIFHCPTNDLTHIQHICNIVATGLPGCGGINPPDKGGDPARRVAADAAGADNADEKEAPEQPATSIPGCGYTKTWGLCETHLLGCGQTKDCPTTMPGCGQTNDCPTTLPGCGWSKNPICTDLPGCGFTKHFGACQQTQPPKCQVSVDIACITQDAACGPTRAPGCGVDQFALQNTTAATVCTQFGCGQQDAQVGSPGSQICATNIACRFTQFCGTQFIQCHPTLICPIVTAANCPTRFQPQCFPVASPFCPVTPGCPFGPGPVLTPNVRGGGGGLRVGAAINPTPPQSLGIICTVLDCGTQQPTELCTPVGCPPSQQPTCPSVAVPCPTPDCTQFQCPTQCGPDCQTQQADCTQVGDLCNSKLQPCTQFGNCKTNPLLDCTFGCTQFGPNCVQITTDLACNTINQPQAFAAAAPRQQAPLTQVGCPASDFVACSQFGGCQTQPNGDCTFFGGCPTNAQVGAAGPVTVCTQSGPQCPTHQLPCTHAGPACPPTPGIICTQFGQQCPTQPSGDCTFFGGCHTNAQIGAAGQPVTVCTQTGPQCPTHQFPCTHAGPACPPTPGIICTQFGQQCPTQPSGDCTFFGGCHTNAQIGAAGPVTVCTQSGPQCPTHQFLCTKAGPACPPTPGIICTQLGPQCPTQQQPCHTPGFECTMFCTHGNPGCPVTQPAAQCFGPLTAPPQCPVHSGFNCPSAIGCQSIACQSIACQPGGGGQQQQFGAAQAMAGGPVQPTPATHCRVCNPPFDQFAAAGGAGIRPTLLIVQCNPSIVDACPTRLIAQCQPSVVNICPTLRTQPVLQCNPSIVDACPTRLCTHQIQCNPSAVDACPTRIGCPTQNPQQCPVATGFNCPSALGCQSIACGQSIACQPGGGGGQQQRFGAAVGQPGGGPIQTIPIGGGPAGWTQNPIWQCFPGGSMIGCTQPGTIAYICTFFHCI